MNRRLECCCCGGDAGRWQQWHNRDTGYGVCAKCVDWIKTRPLLREVDRPDDAEILRLYGQEGVNWGRSA